MHLWQATFRVVILSRLPMLIIGYNHIFIDCFQVDHGYLIIFFKRTLLIVDHPVKTFLNTPRRQEEQDLKAKKSVI
jgi:hypothetical protein